VHRGTKFGKALGELIDLTESAVQAALVIVNVQPEPKICLTAAAFDPDWRLEHNAASVDSTVTENGTAKQDKKAQSSAY
jgi:hypothetical protein